MQTIDMIRLARFVVIAVVPLTAILLISFYAWLRKQESFDIHGKLISPEARTRVSFTAPHTQQVANE